MRPEVTTIDREAWVIVYLAGGMRGGWQDKVIDACNHKRIQFLDPRTHHLTEESDYTAWDLWAVNQSDYVFAYMEKDNPSGQGLMLEIGYACNCGTRQIIFVEDEGDERTRYYGMARQCANEHFIGFEAGLNWFKARMAFHTKDA